METTTLDVEWVPLERVFCSPANPRKNEEAVAPVAASLRRFGWQQPIVAKPDGEVIAGNTRLKAAREIGMDQVPVVWFEGSDLDAAAYAIADNRTHEFAAWDDAALGELLRELRAEDALEGVGFDDAEIDALLAQLEAEVAGDVDDPGPGTPPEEPVTRVGDLWLLGDHHRLLCGDSTGEADVARLLGDDRPALMATDPPYCVKYTGADRPQDSGKDWSDRYKEVEIADLGEFLRSAFGACLPRLKDDAAIYIWHAHLQYPVIDQVFEEFGLLRHQPIIWVKPSSTFTYSFYRWAHEPCIFGWKQGNKPPHHLGNDVTSVWEVDWEGKARVVGNEHPCLHPEALVLTEQGHRPISTVRPGDRVYSADGVFHAVTDVSWHPYLSEDLFQITAKGGNVATLASDNHPFLVWRPERRGRKIMGGSVQWVRADELRVGDYTMTPVLAESDEDPFPERDAEHWFFFGLYLAQGSIQMAGHGENRYPSFALHKKRQDIVRRIRDRWDSVGEYDPNDYGDLPSQGLTVMVFDPVAGAEFEELGGRGARTKRIAPTVLRLPAEKRLAVLAGWLEGDGCRVHNRDYWQGKTSSADLASHLALLGESVGYKVCVFRYEPPAEAATIHGREIRARGPEYHLYFYERDEDPNRGRTKHLEHDGRAYTLRYVKSVETVPYDGEVWNLSVEGCPTFQTSVGMSHNTQKPTRLFEIPMEQHTRRGAVVFEPFSGSGSQIIAAEKLGRRYRAMELAPAFVDVAVRRWEKATGKDATLYGDGRSFAEITEERRSS